MVDRLRRGRVGLGRAARRSTVVGAHAPGVVAAPRALGLRRSVRFLASAPRESADEAALGGANEASAGVWGWSRCRDSKPDGFGLSGAVQRGAMVLGAA